MRTKNVRNELAVEEEPSLPYSSSVGEGFLGSEFDGPTGEAAEEGVLVG